MVYTISIDWLALHCHYMPLVVPAGNVDYCLEENMPDIDIPYSDDDSGLNWVPFDTATGDDRSLFECGFVFRYKHADYGTRQFSSLYLVSTPNDEGGWDDFAEVQSRPHSGILNRNSVIVRFVNRVLYMPDFWDRVNAFLTQNSFVFKGISRIDICADFNQFKTMTATQLIEGFAAKKFRHIGQGVGALYFNHGIMLDKVTRTREYGVQYTGLSFGSHGSDYRTYLYNKSFELLTQGDKPWIRDRWNAVGLDPLHVWRLEVSIKSAACKFKDKITGAIVNVDTTSVADDDQLSKIYHSFVRKKFAFIVNRRKITNISREPRIELFDLHPIYDHRSIRNKSAGNRFEKMFLRALYQLNDLYRGGDVRDDALTAQALAYDIAESTDLGGWLASKINEWETPNHK